MALSGVAVVPDRDAGDGAPAVGFEVELAFERVVDGLNDLA